MHRLYAAESHVCLYATKYRQNYHTIVTPVLLNKAMTQLWPECAPHVSNDIQTLQEIQAKSNTARKAVKSQNTSSKVGMKLKMLLRTGKIRISARIAE